MTRAFLQNLSTVRVEHPDLLVLRRRAELRPIVVEAEGVDGIREAFELTELLALAHVPRADSEVGRGGEQNVVGRWVPLDDGDLPLVTLKNDHGIRHGFRHFLVWDLPDLDCGIIRPGRNDVFVERTPVEIQHGACMSGDPGEVHVNAPVFVNGEDNEGPTTAGLHDDGDKFRVH